MHAIYKLVLASLVTFTAAAGAPAAAQACGGYGAVSEEDRARSAVLTALHAAKVDMERVGAVDVTLQSSERAVADVTIDDEGHLRLSLVKRQGRWTVRSPRRA